MKNIFLAIIFMSLLSACSNKPSESTNPVVGKDALIIGIWGMIPLKNGIANVVEFTEEGKSNLYSFNCRDKKWNGNELSTYTITDDEKYIRLNTNGNTQDLNLITVGEKSMILGQKLGDGLLTFAYVKIKRVFPLCFMYKESEEEIAKESNVIQYFRNAGNPSIDLSIIK